MPMGMPTVGVCWEVPEEVVLLVEPAAAVVLYWEVAEAAVVD